MTKEGRDKISEEKRTILYGLGGVQIDVSMGILNVVEELTDTYSVDKKYESLSPEEIASTMMQAITNPQFTEEQITTSLRKKRETKNKGN